MNRQTVLKQIKESVILMRVLFPSFLMAAAFYLIILGGYAKLDSG